MADADVTQRSAQVVPYAAEGTVEVSLEDYSGGFGESIRATLDLDTWTAGEDLGKLYGRIDAEVQEAVAQEDAIRKTIREQIFPRLSAYRGAPTGAGDAQDTSFAISWIPPGFLLHGG